MSPDPPFAALLDGLSALQKGVSQLGSVKDLRRRLTDAAHRFEPDAPVLSEIRSLAVEGAAGDLPARLYIPTNAKAPAGPGLVFFHGGGFVLGDLDTHDMLCRRLAAAGGLRVLSVAYRLAPEHKFPAAPLDATAAVRWAFTHAARIGFEPSRIAVGGDSAGGTLAAVAAQELKRANGPRLAAQLLIYPCVQFLELKPSHIRFADAARLTQATQDFFKDAYLAKREDAFDVRASPLLENALEGLPPALIVTAGLDPLRDEGLAYADKLAACGVAAAARDYKSQVHGFFSMTAVSPQARKAIEECGGWLSKTLTPA